MSLSPAEELPPETDEPDRCSECGREPAADEALEDWRVEADGLGERYTFCPECWDREFGGGRLD